MTPTVSIVLNCYNHEPYLGEAIESVLKQTFEDFELILVDNGSTDGSRRIMQSYSDPRIRLALNDKNESLSKRLNEGVAMARGEFVSILYSDDFMLPEKLEHQVELLRGLPPEYGAVYCPALALNQRTGERWQHNSMALEGAMIRDLLRNHYRGAIDMVSPLTRRECYLRYPWFEDQFGDGEAVFFRIGMRWRFHFDPKPLAVLRDHGANMGKALCKNHEMLLAILDRIGRHPDFPPEAAGDLKAFYATACQNNGWAVLRMDGDAAWVRRQLGRSLRIRPSQLLHPRMIGGVVLATIPFGLRKLLNAAASRMRRVRENRSLVESY